MKRPRRFKLRYMAIVAVGGWAAYTYFVVQAPQLSALQSKQQHLENQLHQLQQQRVNLNQKIQEFQSNAYIAQYASEHFGLILPGQVAFTEHK